MMATTHVFAGLVLAAIVALIAPQFAAVAAFAAILGGLFPDLDVVADHRKTLHYPVYYSALAVPTLLIAVVVPGPATVALAVFVLAAAGHSVADCVGGSHELKPWQAGSNRAVYSHYHGQWLEPRRWIGYDGSPGDLALSAVLAVPALFVFDGTVQVLVVGMLVVSIAYATLRRPVAAGVDWLVRRENQ
ncbi:metal-dependent hydrolase [Natrarchaeobius halalkaliphilus]|uniref:Metal-dependent hydrolase n=1 Tax=Natrarchaeobius halalkaliphilus TaxID=1679091 RepID=A0A3N6LKR5_9EURY|nr:metal-dependent hydrolase [Natrarchaeobius halalkaliphilus]RQG89268.1 metal-dependent hydrolase [Natrarchaeobius halalkaliphilus]